ncbi:dihydrofolate reductase family protein [Lysobacter korlensis]|uniref:Dihydrofolate reductase family protein n=1 Tax=Lysobacter korlensis TaxID=553636 RepID=A0ABV6RWJ9_9GAMM
MRTVIVSNIVSLDGFYEGEGGDFTVLEMDEAFDAYNLERIEAADAVLLGRRSFEMFSSHWPFIADAPDDPGNRMVDEVNRAIGRAWNRTPIIVVSESYVVPSDNPWASQTTVVPRDSVGEALHGDVVVFGSRTMWNGLLTAGLVDEVHLMLSPRAVGRGVTTFADRVELEPIGVRRFDGSRNILTQYRVLR